MVSVTSGPTIMAPLELMNQETVRLSETACMTAQQVVAFSEVYSFSRFGFTASKFLL